MDIPDGDSDHHASHIDIYKTTVDPFPSPVTLRPKYPSSIVQEQETYSLFLQTFRLHNGKDIQRKHVGAASAA